MSIAPTTIAPPDTREIQTAGEAIRLNADAIVVDSAGSFEVAGTFLREVAAIRKRVKETFNGPIGAAYAAHKAMIEARDKHDRPLADAERTVKRKMGAWQQAEDERRRAEEERLRAEEQRKADELALAQAAELEKAGQTEAAQAVIETPPAPAPVVLPKTTPKVAGVSTQKRWLWKVADEDKIPREYLMVDRTKIGGVVRAMKGATNIPGVEVWSETGVAVRST